MANVNRTFSESWYRVADLRPRLRATVQTHRQHFRGRIWHVVQDPTNNSFFRLHPAAYRFVAMLDGRRTVSSATVYLGNPGYSESIPTPGQAGLLTFHRTAMHSRGQA